MKTHDESGNRIIRSYKDIAEYIIDELRIAQTAELPAWVADHLGTHGWYTRQQAYGTMYPLTLELNWQPASRMLRHTVLDVNNEIVLELRFYVAQKSNAPKTFGSHDSHGNPVD